MELVAFVLIVIGLLAILDIAALRWGQWTRRLEEGYDPRYNWQPRDKDK